MLITNVSHSRHKVERRLRPIASKAYNRSSMCRREKIFRIKNFSSKTSKKNINIRGKHLLSSKMSVHAKKKKTVIEAHNWGCF